MHNFHGNPFLNAVSPLERVSTGFFGDYEVTDGVQVFGEFLYTYREDRSDRDARHAHQPDRLGQQPDQPDRPEASPSSSGAWPSPARAIASRRPTPGRRPPALRGKLGEGLDVGSGRQLRPQHRDRRLHQHRQPGSASPTRSTPASARSRAGAAIPCADYLGPGDVTPAVLDYILSTTRDTGGNEHATSARHDRHAVRAARRAARRPRASSIARRRAGATPTADVLGSPTPNQQSPISGSVNAKEAYLELQRSAARGPAVRRGAGASTAPSATRTTTCSAAT